MKLPNFLFEWPSRHNIHIALPLLLLLSIGLHALGVIIFQVSYPHATFVLPRSAEVTFLLPGSRDAERLGPRIASSDPALYSPAAHSAENAPVKLAEARYIPSYDSQKPSLESLPVAQEGEGNLTVRALSRALLMPSGTATVAPGLPTQIQFADGLAGREATFPPEMRFASQPLKYLTPSEFLIFVSPEGAVRHVFTQVPSGDEKLDETASKYLMQCRFASTQGNGVWGTARFLWGSDVIRQKSP